MVSERHTGEQGAGIRTQTHLLPSSWHWVHVVPSPQESMDNSPSLFDYGLDDSYNDHIDDFDPYLEYGKGYRNRTAFKDAFYG